MRKPRARRAARGAYDWREALAPTMIAAAAWFGMTALMLAAPSAMVACGIPAAGVAGLLAWHVVAMYAPGFGVAALAKWIGAPVTALAGLALVIMARLALGGATESRVVWRRSGDARDWLVSRNGCKHAVDAKGNAAARRARPCMISACSAPAGAWWGRAFKPRRHLITISATSAPAASSM